MNVPALHRLLAGFTGSLVFLAAFGELWAVLLGRKREPLRTAAAWALACAAAVTPITALAGYLVWGSMVYVDQRRLMPHLWLGVAVATALVPLAVWRGRTLGRPRGAGPAFLAAVLVAFGASAYQGYVGSKSAFLQGEAASHDGCEHGHADAGEDEGPGSAPASAPVATQYACPMHPEVRSPRPGACPECGMGLARVAEPRPGGSR